MFVILVYDISEKRVAKILKICRKYLYWVQNSVFEGDITKAKLEQLKLELQKNIKDEDSVIIYEFRSKRYYKRDILGKEKNPLDTFL